jgi:hypothetical protein
MTGEVGERHKETCRVSGVSAASIFVATTWLSELTSSRSAMVGLSCTPGRNAPGNELRMAWQRSE